jgi:hypothetical protein
MAARDRKLAIGMLLPAVLLFAIALATCTPEIQPGPVPPQPAAESIPELAAPAPLPEEDREEPRGVDDPRVSARDDNICEVLVLGWDEAAVGSRTMSRPELIRELARFADGGRYEVTDNLVSSRQLIVRAEPKTPWSAVRSILLTAIDPAVRIYRVSLAEAGGEPVPVTLFAEWLPGPDGERTAIEPVATVTVELKRRAGEIGTRVKLLDSQVGTDGKGFERLEDCVLKILKSPGNEGLPSEVSAWGAVPYSDVLMAMRILWRQGYPRVRLLCLMPDDISGPGAWVDPRVAAARLVGEEKTTFLLDTLWESRSVRGSALEDLLHEVGPRLAGPILARLADDGLPKRQTQSEVEAPYKQVPELSYLLHSFGEQVVPELLLATSSHSKVVRRIAVRALGEFDPLTTEVETAMLRMLDLDPDPKVRQAARDSLRAARLRLPRRDPD